MFTTLATLVFEVDGLPARRLCGGDAGAGRLRARRGRGASIAAPGDPDTDPAGAFGDFVVAADGATTRTLSVKPEFLSRPDGRLTVTEMRGHALVFRAGDAVAACGVIPAGGPREASG